MAKARHILPSGVLYVVIASFAILYLGMLSAASAQQTQVSTVPASVEYIQLSFPENIEVKALVDYVAGRLGFNVLFQDEAVGRRKITLTCPTKIPKDSLGGLLNSILKTSGLAMVDAEQPGWKKVVAVQDMLAITEGLGAGQRDLDKQEATAVVSRVFALRHAAGAGVEQTIRPFLSKPGGNSFPIAEGNLLVVTDYAGNLRRIAELIELLDRPGRKPVIRFVPVRHLEAADLARQVSALLADRDRLAAAAGKAPGGAVVLTAEARTNRIAVISTEGVEADAVELIEKLDVPLELATQTYRIRHVPASRIDKLAKDLLAGDKADGRYKSVIDAESGMLVVTASAEAQRRLRELIDKLDVPEAREAAAGNMRFYKLMNTTVGSVLATIRAMEGGADGKGLMTAELATRFGATGPGGERFTGPNNPPASVGQFAPEPPAYQPTTMPTSQPAESSPAAPTMTARTKDAVVTADVNTNTLIVIAPPAVQETYEQLIAMLDKRRPQVMIEVTLVTMDASDSISLGVEMARLNQGDNPSLIFSSFGLTTINQATGTLALIPGAGFNGILISPDTVSAVVRALASSAKARVVSAPRVLVNDNATAMLSGISEAPYTSINASATVSTTSFAGYASAGTTITVTPHISEGDHLQLEYSITLNSFTGSGSTIAPPPRQTNSINSQVTVPDGYAVVVGGLRRKNSSDSSPRVPLLGDIPVLNYLFGSRSNTASDSTLFAFIRPVILRDDQFEDLKYLSDRDWETAGLSAGAPSNDPLLLQ